MSHISPSPNECSQELVSHLPALSDTPSLDLDGFDGYATFVEHFTSTIDAARVTGPPAE